MSLSITDLLPANLPEGNGNDYYERSLVNGPARELSQWYGNVASTFPSLKNKRTRRSESLSELLVHLLLEYDVNVEGYSTQPELVMVDRPVYMKGGKSYIKGVSYISDVTARLKSGVIVVIQAKKACDIERDITARERDGKECRISRVDGRYEDARAKVYFESIGVVHLVVTDKDFGPEYYRNISLLDPYFDHECPHQSLVDGINLELASEGLLTIEQLAVNLDKRWEGESKSMPERGDVLDCIYWMLVNCHVFGDLHFYSIQDVHRYALSSSKKIAQLWVANSQANRQSGLKSAEFRLSEDSIIKFAGKSFSLVNCLDGTVYLKRSDGKLEEYKEKDLVSLFQEGALTCESCNPEIIELTPFSRANSKRQKEALRRAQAIAMHESKVHLLPASTYTYYKRKERQGVELFGCGLSGLIPSSGGNFTSKTCKRSLNLMHEYLQFAYLGMKMNPESEWCWPRSLRVENENVQDSWGEYSRICKKNEIAHVSRSTFYRAVKKIDLVKRKLVNAGKKAAYQVEDMTSGEWSGMTHGSFAGHIVEIDHTIVDLEVVDDDDVGLGRLCLSLAIDTFSRAVLGYHLGFGKPSRVAVMMVVKNVVMRNKFMPLCFSVDGGPEFHSIYFDQLCARHRVLKRSRPPGKAKSGSIIERNFKVLNNDFWHKLIGSTRLMVNPRVLTKEFTARERAIWGVSELIDAFGQYIDGYNKSIPHGSLGEPPMVCFGRSYDALRPPQKRIICYDANFKVSCLLSPDKKKPLKCGRGGLRINNGYYTHPILKEESSRGMHFSVRWSPWDLRTIYFDHNGVWEEALLAGSKFSHALSLKEVDILSNELKARSSGTCKRDNARIFMRAEVTAQIKDQEVSLEMRKAQVDRELNVDSLNKAENLDPKGLVTSEAYDPIEELPIEPIRLGLFDE